MTQRSVTRREVITFLGIKMPIVLVGVQILPGKVRAEEQCTQINYQISPAARDETISNWSGSPIRCTAHNDSNGNIGTIITAMDKTCPGHDIVREGDIIYKVNGKPCVIKSQKDFEEWSKSLIEMIIKKQEIAVDLDRDTKPYLIVVKFA